MIRKLAIRFAVLLASANFIACNSSTYEDVEETASAAVVRSFSLAEDDDVMANLDSVFFSIDLVNGRIFNADSLPAGTKVTALVPQITTLEGASLLELTVTRAGKADTVIYYTGSAEDTVDFTNPVRLRVVSPDRLTERTYQISVNVHRMVTDSLAWNTKESFALPTTLTAPDTQRSTRAGDKLYVLTAKGNDYCLAWYHDVDNLGRLYLNQAPMTMTTQAIPLSFAPQIETFTGTPDGTMYMLDTDGKLYSTTERGFLCNDWTACGYTWKSVIGAYGNELLGVAAGNDGSHYIQTSTGRTMPLPDGMPVEGFSMPVEYSFPMSGRPQLMIVGGRKADGTLSADAWGFDGSTWAKISRRALPVALEGATLAPYVVIRATGAIKTTEQNAILIFGGRKADGTLSDVTYVSTDFGVNWRKADSTLQLPQQIPAMWGAQAFVFTTTMTDATAASLRKRVSRPVEYWQCPYIYLLGARDASGTLNTTVWRGVINKLSFKPIV